MAVLGLHEPNTQSRSSATVDSNSCFFAILCPFRAPNYEPLLNFNVCRCVCLGLLLAVVLPLWLLLGAEKFSRIYIYISTFWKQARSKQAANMQPKTFFVKEKPLLREALDWWCAREFQRPRDHAKQHKYEGIRTQASLSYPMRSSPGRM